MGGDAAGGDGGGDSPFHPECLRGRRALVTGGGSGIGREIARQLGLHGARVALQGRREAVLQQAVEDFSREGIDVMAAQGDVRSPEDAERVLAAVSSRFGGLDILINCAAGNFLATPEELNTKGFKTVMDIDAVGTFNMSRAAFPHLKAAGSSLILNVSATLHYGATWYQVHASAAKAAVDSMTRSLGMEWGQFGVRVVGVAPGPIRGTAGMSKLAPGFEEMVAQTIPLQRMGERWDIAMAAVYLASSAGRFVTGETLVVDGAAWMWKPNPIPREMISKASRGVEKKSRAKL